MDENLQDSAPSLLPEEHIELPAHDKADLDQLYATPDGGEGVEPPKFHPILEVWREVLRPARAEVGTVITPQWANKMVGAYQGVTFRDLVDLRDIYYRLLVEMLEILETEIESDAECLTWDTPELDVEHNGAHYRQVLTDWQLHFLKEELEWDCTSITAAVELAAMSEVHKIFFGAMGITAFLEQIRFEYSDEDQAELERVLVELRDSYERVTGE